MLSRIMKTLAFQKHLADIHNQIYKAELVL